MKKQPAQKGQSRKTEVWLPLLILVVFGMVIGLNGNTVPLESGTENVPPKPQASSAIPSSPSAVPKITYKILIDAGHGGIDPGASGASGIEEKVYTLSLSKKIYDLLKQDPLFDPYLTRTDDSFIDLTDRAKMANDRKVEAFISVHANYFRDSKVRGTETYYSSDGSARLAQLIHENLVVETGFPDREIRKRQLKILFLSNTPSILVETGYLTNPNEEAVLLSSEGQDRAALAIVDGLKQYFNQT